MGSINTVGVGVGGGISQKAFSAKSRTVDFRAAASGARPVSWENSIAMLDPLLPGRGRRMGTAGAGGLALIVISLALVALVTLKVPVPLPHLLP